MCDADERVAGDGRETEEGDRRPTRQIGEDEQCHAFGHCGVRVRCERRLIVAADGSIHVRVAQRNKQETDAVEDEQRQQVNRVRQVVILQRQADANIANRIHEALTTAPLEKKTTLPI